MEPLPNRSSRREFLKDGSKTVAAATATTSAALSMFLENPFVYGGQASETLSNERNKTMSRIKGTQTEKNLLKAFAGESQARSRYTFFSAQAAEEGFHHIAYIFKETAEQELIHAQQFFQYLDNGGPLEITATYPAGVILNTEKNLEEAAAGEYEEWHDLYPEFAKVAREEGFADIARTWTAVCVSEKQHEKRYRGFLEHLKAGDLFTRDNVTWRCRHCGYIAEGPSAPGVCPACKMTQAWFEILAENW